MFANSKALFFVAVATCAVFAQAQSSGSASTTTMSAPASQSSPVLDQCIITCATQAAASAGCSSYTDLTCVCTSTTFQQDALGCLQANCTAADLASAQAIQVQECAALSSGASSGVASTGASTAVSATATSATSSATSTSTSAAMALSAPLSFNALIGTLVAVAGTLVGGAMML